MIINKIRIRLVGEADAFTNNFRVYVTDNYGQIIQQKKLDAILDKCILTSVESKNGHVSRGKHFKIINFWTHPEMEGNFYIDLKYAILFFFDSKLGNTDRIELYQKGYDKEIKSDGFLKLFANKCCSVKISTNDTQVVCPKVQRFYLVIEAEIKNDIDLNQGNYNYALLSAIIFIVAIVLKILYNHVK